MDIHLEKAELFSIFTKKTSMRQILALLFLLPLTTSAQPWVDAIQTGTKHVDSVKHLFDTRWTGQEMERGQGTKQFYRWFHRVEERTYPHGQTGRLNALYAEGLEVHRALKKQHSGERAGNWTPLGPFDWNSVSYNPGSGRVNVVVQDPNNANVLYAGTPSGGLWKSTAGGGSWTPLTDDLASLGVSGIAVDHTNSNHLYIGTGDGDGGDSYSIGVLESFDGGQTWQNTGLTHSTSQAITTRRLIMNPQNPNSLLLATNNGLYKTTDGGANWTMTQSGSMRDVEYKPGDTSIVYVCSNEFFRSTDGGNTFTMISAPLPGSQSNRLSIGVSPDEPSWVYVISGDASDGSFLGCWLSQNDGITFTLQVANGTNYFSYPDDGSGSGGQSSYDMALAVNPNNADEIFIGGINVWHSTNRGVNFTINCHWTYPPLYEYVHADIHTIDFYGGALYCGSDGGLFRSTNLGGTWNQIDQGMQIMQIYRMGGTPQNPNLLISGAQDNGSNVMNGSQWTHVYGADGMEASIDPTDPLTMYCETQFGGVLKSTDGGLNFNGITGSINGSAAWVTPHLLDPTNPNIVYIGYEDVWKSTNGGSSFSAISNFGTGNTIREIVVAASDNNYIYASTVGLIYMTDDGGNNWQSINSNLPNNSISYIAVHPSNPDLVYVTQSGFSAGEKVFVSHDGGQNWTNISSNLPNLPVNCIVLQAGTNGGMYVGTDVGVYYTDSTLSNWQPFSDDLPNVGVEEMEIHYGTQKIRAATYGRGMWESDLFTPSTLPPVAQIVYQEEVLCPGDSIQFSDNSLYAAPGWTWYFPGGSPSSSTLANPKVLYATAGSYTASLVVANPNGSDSTTQNVTVDLGSETVIVDLLTDSYPTETSWAILDSNGNTVAQGDGYSVTNFLYSDTVCLHEGCYTFEIYDQYGDGICCGFGNGAYTVFDDQGNQLANGGQFAFSESTTICLPYGLSIDEPENPGFHVYPNPARSMIMLEMVARGNYEIQLLDLTGRTIRKHGFYGYRHDVSIDNTSAGTYVIRVVNLDNGTFSQQKVIKL